VLVAAAPSWFADNLVLIAAVTLVVVTIVVLRVMQKTVTRSALLLVVGAVAVFLYANRLPLEECARTCECRVVRQDVSVPFCDSDLDLSAAVRGGPRLA
jgi:hypothetical protein